MEQLYGISSVVVEYEKPGYDCAAYRRGLVSTSDDCSGYERHGHRERGDKRNPDGSVND